LKGGVATGGIGKIKVSIRFDFRGKKTVYGGELHQIGKSVLGLPSNWRGGEFPTTSD